MNNLLTALIKAKKEFKSIVKSANNPFYKSKYATLDTILDSVEPALLNNGLILVQPVIENNLYTRLYHAESGEYLESIYILPELSDPQKLGSAITYARRYGVSAMLSLSTDDDDDGHVASGKADVITTTQLDKLQKLVSEKGLTSEIAKSIILKYGYTHSSNILKVDYDKIYKELQKLGK
jgi:hypothetical protein